MRAVFLSTMLMLAAACDIASETTQAAGAVATGPGVRTRTVFPRLVVSNSSFPAWAVTGLPDTLATDSIALLSVGTNPALVALSDYLPDGQALAAVRLLFVGNDGDGQQFDVGVTATVIDNEFSTNAVRQRTATVPHIPPHGYSTLEILDVNEVSTADNRLWLSIAATGFGARLLALTLVSPVVPAPAPDPVPDPV